MKQTGMLLSYMALFSVSSAIDLQIAALDPKEPGQIGINPVTAVTTVITATNAFSIDTQATGNPKANIGGIGVHTDLLTEDAGTTKWIGPNTAYLTALVQTSTISGVVSIITGVPSIEIVGTVDDDGLPTGAFDLVVSPMLVEQIQNLANTLCQDKTTCSADFPPRVEALLKGGGSILTKRGISAGEGVAGVAVLVAAAAQDPRVQNYFLHVVTTYWQMAFGGEPIPNVIHVDVTQGAAPSPTVMIATTFVMTAEVMPTIKAVGNDDDPDESDDDEDGICWKYVGVDDPLSPDTVDEASTTDDDSAPEKRSVAGRIQLYREASPLHKRAQKNEPVLQIGNCDYRPKSVIYKARVWPQTQVVMRNFDMQESGPNHGLDPKMYWYVPEQNIDDFNKACVIAKLTKKGKKNPTDPSTKINNFPLPYDQSVESKMLTVEHIYTGLGDGERSRFYTLWSQQSNPLPGNWALAGVDARINNLKGKLFNPGLSEFPTPKPIEGNNADSNFDRLFQLWNNAGLSLDFTNDPDVASYFADRTAKVYAALRDFEKIQICEKDPHDTTISVLWAEEFKKYMTSLLLTNQVLLQARITELDTKIKAQGTRLTKPGTTELNEYANAHLALMATYPISRFVFNIDALLKFPENSLGIRDATQTDSCAKPAPSAACVERTIIDCLYHYTDRPELSIENCPPIPVLPASCVGGPTLIPTPNPIPTPIPAPTPQPPVLSAQGCYDKENHEDILGAQVSSDAGFICDKAWNDGGKVTMDANTIAKTYHPVFWWTETNNYWYGVGWIKGCQTTSATQLVGDPMGDGNKDHTCANLLSNSWANCNNGGTGGWIDAGCLRYTFKASPNKLTTNWAGVVKTE